MSDPLRLAGRTAVVTGAASGIGRALAASLAHRGCNLALADVDESGLTETAVLVGAAGVRVSMHRLDVADRDAVAAFPETVTSLHAGVDLLVNNAGVAVGGKFEQVCEANFDWLFDINFHGVVRMTRAFLPLLRASDDARLVNMSSVFGLIAPAGQVAYAASKFAVRGFSEGLRHELEGSTVGVTVVHPGGVATSIADNARPLESWSQEERTRRLSNARKHLRLPPARAAEIIVRGIERRKERVLVGVDAVLLSLTARLAPVSYWKLLSPLIR
ncbi:MAG: SDR family NAD(P)-dependent oxidoreductase [Gemmatimonadota bacterium]